MTLTERAIEAGKMLGPWLTITAVALIAVIVFSLSGLVLPAKADFLKSLSWVCLFLSYAAFGVHMLTKRD